MYYENRYLYDTQDLGKKNYSPKYVGRDSMAKEFHVNLTLLCYCFYGFLPVPFFLFISVRYIIYF